MTETKIFGYKNPKDRAGNHLQTDIWNHTIPVYRCAPHVWNVAGQDDVCAYLLDSGEGLILLDTGLEETLYMLVHHVMQLGYQFTDIKKILLSHHHFDHVDCARLIQEMAGGPEKCEIWLSREDEENHQRLKDRPKGLHKGEVYVRPYTVDHFYSDDEPVVLGRFSIRTVLTPGHTRGATSFFFEDTDEETGKTYRCAMHGGLGVGNMKPEKLPGKELIDESVCERFVEQSLEIAEWPVDIFLPSHLNQGNVDEHLPEDPDNWKWFIADYAWHDSVKNRAEEVMSYWPEKYPDLIRTCPTLK